MVLRARQIIQNEECPLCHSDVESSLHILHDCPRVAPIWSALTNSLTHTNLNCNTTSDWLTTMVSHHLPRPPCNVPWSMIFPVAIWCIWSARNKLLWEDSNFNPDIILKRVLSTTTNLFHSLPSKLLSTPKPIHLIGWTHPQSGFSKLNSDGSALGNPSCACAATIIRDSRGAWISSCTRKIGHTYSLEAEL